MDLTINYKVFTKIIEKELIILIFENDVFQNCFWHNDDPDDFLKRYNIITRLKNQLVVLRKDLLDKFNLSILIDPEKDIYTNIKNYGFIFIIEKNSDKLIDYGKNSKFNYDQLIELIKTEIDINK